MKTVDLKSVEEFSKHVSPRSVPLSFRPYRAFGKRALDLLMALALLPIIGPVLLVLALLVKTDGGPAFYVQKRVGRHGKHFNCLKLRSMRIDAEAVLAELCRTDPDVRAEWELYQKLDKDPRITRVGNFLRKTSLDELPQLINVLVGDMSFIGPRPFLPSQHALYTSAGGSAYFKLRPGISGPWQVSSRNASTFVERVQFDETYLRSLSLCGDIRIALKTVAVILRASGK